MALGQKQAVINEVLKALPAFTVMQDNAILKLSSTQLEDIKANIYNDIITGLIDYSKDRTNLAEVRTYARSMVMNHLKKAKELNGGNVISIVRTDNSNAVGTTKTTRTKVKLAPKGVNLDLLPEDLAEYAKTLV